MTKTRNPKPDDRSDNVKRIKNHIDNTIENMEFAEDLIKTTDNEKTKRELKEKNKRREDALTGLREEIRDEARDKKRSGK